MKNPRTKLTFMNKIMMFGCALAVVSCDKPKLQLETDEARYSYALGMQVAKNLKSQKIDLDVKSFSAAVEDVMANKTLLLNDKESEKAIAMISELRQAKAIKAADENKKMGEAFLAVNKSKEGVQTTASGLQYKAIRLGTGPKPQLSDIVEIHYKSKILGGIELDNTFAQKKPPGQSLIKSLFPGLIEGLQLMPVGSKFEFAIPSQLAYGDKTIPFIPAFSVLLYEVELLKIIKK